MSWELGKTPNFGFVSSWCQLAGFGRGTQGGVQVMIRVRMESWLGVCLNTDDVRINRLAIRHWTAVVVAWKCCKTAR